MAGKNKIERGFRIYFDDSGATARDLSGDLVAGSVSGGGKQYEQVDLMGVSEAFHNFLANFWDSEISAQFHLNDTATTGAFTVLSNQEGGTGTLTLQWGSAGAAPTSNDPEWEGEYVLLGAPVSFSGGAGIMTATWKPTGSTAPAWGLVA